MQWIAHRGLQAKFPENTLLACQQAYANGLRKIEVDLQFSRDGIAMLYHDLSLHRVSEHNGLISQYDAEQLCQISAFEPQRFDQQFANNKIDRLSDLVEWAKDKPELELYIEFKEESLAHISREHALNEMLNQCQAILKQCYFISFDLEFIRLNQARSLVKSGLVLSNWEQTHSMSDYLSSLDCVFCNQQKIDISQLPDKIDHWVLYEIADIVSARHWQQLGFCQFESFEAARLSQL